MARLDEPISDDPNEISFEERTEINDKLDSIRGSKPAQVIKLMMEMAAYRLEEVTYTLQDAFDVRDAMACLDSKLFWWSQHDENAESACD